MSEWHFKFNLGQLRARWQSLRTSAGFHSAVTFMGFCVVALLLWFIMTLNDSTTASFDVYVDIEGVPKDVTFITTPPARIRATVRDKGTSLMRAGFLRNLRLSINFNEFARNNRLQFGKSELYASLREVFGATAQITSVSTDSICGEYTSNPGRRLPIDVMLDAEPASGYVISSRPRLSRTSVLVYSNSNLIDTLTRVYTEEIVRRDLSETTKVAAKIIPIPGARIVPTSIELTIPVEPLVRKQSMVAIVPAGVPDGISLLLFPSMVEVSYFVPMSLYNDEAPDIIVSAEYGHVDGIHSGKLAIRVAGYPTWCANPVLATDSVEFTIVR